MNRSQSIVRVIRGVASMSAVFVRHGDQFLACMESATLEYSMRFQCVGALLGRLGRVKFVIQHQIRKKLNERTYHSHTTTV